VNAHPALPEDTLRIVEIHYFRIPRERWELMILRARQSGANGISAYIPWIHHEPTPGTVDLSGSTLAERDLVGFVTLCADAGLGFIAKPGPFCDSEMLGGGVPTWLIAQHPDWWAIRHDGEPYRHGDSYDERLSYDHPEAHAAAADWLCSVAEALEGFVGRNLWAFQIDNETPGDGMWIHDDDGEASPLRGDFASVGRWQQFLAHRHGTIEALNASWDAQFGSFEDVRYPDEWSAPESAEQMRRWIDLDRFADHQMASGLSAYANAVQSVLAHRVPLFHDWLCMPWRLSGMLVEPGVLADTCDWVGQNVYAENVDPTDMIAGTNWYKMNDAEYIHHAWWRTRLCHTLSPAGMPHLVPEISARQAFYLQCSLVGGMDAPCIYMLHSSEPEPEGIGAFQRWAEEAPVLPDGNVFEWWWNMRCLFLCLEAGGGDLAGSPLSASVAIAYDHAGERLARWAGEIPGAGFPEGSELGALCAASNTSAAGLEVAHHLVAAMIEFDVVDATRSPLDRYEVIIVPDVRVLSRAASDALSIAAASGTNVIWVGTPPSHDEDLHELGPNLAEATPLTSIATTVLAATTHRSTWDHRSALPGLDLGVRGGARGRRYVTVVNRSRQSRSGVFETIPLDTNPASVTWFALDGDRIVAAMLHGDDARVGTIECSQGQCAVAFLSRSGANPPLGNESGAWHVISQERAWITIPAAAGRQMWRVMLAGRVIDVGTVPADGRFRFVHQDDDGQTDRYVLGDRAHADAVSAPVNHFFETTLAAAEAESNAVDVPSHEASHRIRRIRSAIVAGTAIPAERALLDHLTRIAGRTNDIRLGES